MGLSSKLQNSLNSNLFVPQDLGMTAASGADYLCDTSVLPFLSF